MSAREQLACYIQQLERRLRLWASLRGAAVVALSALLASVVLVAIANRFAFSGGSVGGARLALLAVLAVAAALGLVLPLRRLGQRRAVARAEAQFPEFQQRLTTFQGHDPNDPFLELLAADTLDLTAAAPPQHLAPDTWLYGSLGVGVASLAALVWMIAAGPGFWGYGAALLWTGPRRHATPLYSLKVTPGNAVVRRHGDELITALPQGWASPQVRLFARYQSASKWEEAPMRARAGAAFQYLIAGLPEDVDYYVQSGTLRSPTYHLRVRDLPAVKQIAVTYHYPSWTGRKDASVAHAGDLRAVAGTQATLEITTDQPLQQGKLAFDYDTGEPQLVPLAPDGANRYRAQFTLQKDGVYHVASVVAGEDPSQPTRLSEDYFIAAPPAAPPQIALVRPGRDYRASPIEEVTVAAQASDEFGLEEMALHYAVNGGPEKTVELLKQVGTKQAEGQSVLSLESFHAQPGDLVSLYASAQDGHATARTDMIFIQADPFERDFSQSQQSGGGGGSGGGGNASAQITDREKEIIAGTFRQQHDTSGSAQLASDTAKLLSQSQSTLHDQAMSLSGRMQARELTDQNQAFSDFQKDMIAAAAAMAPAAQSLQGEKWGAAIPKEEKALSRLLRAEATFRQIQVAFGARGGGGGGGSAARDLASLFDLELDTQKNQYETQPTASTAEKQSQSIDDTLKKLDQLAQRQQQLAQPQNQTAQSAQQRWEQDLLRREAEQLQRQLQQLAQNGQSGQASQSGQSGRSGPAGQSGQASSSSLASSSGASGASSSQQAQAQAAEQALQRLQQANVAMQRAGAANESAQQRAADSQEAAAMLRQARQALAGLQQDNAQGRLAGMANQADQLAQQQKQQADEVRQLIASKKPASDQELNQLIQGRQQVSNQFDQLQRTLRNAARELNSAQPAVSNQLRGALDGLDANDLGTRLQRSADWLRNGNFSDGSETAITHDLRQLGQQLRQAQGALSGAQRADSNAAIASAMNQLERLRQQLAQAQAGRGGSQGSTGASANLRGLPAGQQYQPGQLSRDGQSGQQAGQQGQAGPGSQRGAQSAQNGGGRGGQSGGNRNGNGVIGDRVAGNRGSNQGGARDGRVGNAVGGADSRQYGNGGYDMGNTHIVGQAAAPQQGPHPADSERQIQQGLDALNRVRQALPNDAETQRQIQSLIRQMQGLDPSRFPGNPAMVAAMHQELLTSVDTLELQLRRKLDASQGGQIRDHAPQPAPPGYADAVAAYYRQLSRSGGGGH